MTIKQPTTVLLIKFKTQMSEDELLRIAKDRANEFRALAGLVQKYYVRDKQTGEVGGLYLWDSPEALDEYRKSELRASIAAAYNTTGAPDIQVLDVLMVLREGEKIRELAG
jgi:quinol monooxygenase YgiN